MFSRKRQTACERIREMFSPYIDGQLSAVEQEIVDFHVNVCDACRYQLVSLEKTAGLLKSMPVVPFPRSFTLAEAPARGIQLPFAIPSLSWMRIATAAVAIVIVALVAIDLTGAFDKPGESVVASPTPIPTEDVQPTPTSISPQPSEGVTIPESMPPDPSGDSTGVATLDTHSSRGHENLTDTGFEWEFQPQADPSDGVEGEGLSPTPPPHSPSWLLPAEIVASILVAILGITYFRNWYHKQAPSTTDRQ